MDLGRHDEKSTGSSLISIELELNEFLCNFYHKEVVKAQCNCDLFHENFDILALSSARSCLLTISLKLIFSTSRLNKQNDNSTEDHFSLKTQILGYSFFCRIKN